MSISLLLAKHPTSHSRTKHIAVHYHHSRELVEAGMLELVWMPTNRMVADMLTKGLDAAKMALFSALCGMRNLTSEGGCENKARGAGEEGGG
ncbi:hypothetical protein JCM3774_003585 [Rhodotorula dairenensis]